MTLSERIKQLRCEPPKMSQEELGKKIGYGKSTISSYENGNTQPSIEQLCKLSDCFQVTVDYLLARTDVRDLPIFTPSHKELFDIFNSLDQSNQNTLLSQARFLQFQQNPPQAVPETPNVDFVDPFQGEPTPRKATQLNVAQKRTNFFDASDDD